MYGLLLESTRFYIRQKYGDQLWQLLCRHCDSGSVFTSHERYNDTLLPRLAEVCSAVLPCAQSKAAYMEFFGKCFVEFTANYGYSKVLTVYSRNFRDLLDSIDSLHEHLRFRFPVLQSPSFECKEESSQGLTLHYRSRRYGFMNYVIGQVKELALRYFKLEIDVKIIKEENQTVRLEKYHVVYRIIFDNSKFMPVFNERTFLKSDRKNIPLDLVFTISPFSFLVDKNLRIYRTGKDLNEYFGENMAGKYLHNVFVVRRPPINLTWEELIYHERVIFELIAKQSSNMSLFENADLQDISSMLEEHDIVSRLMTKAKSHGMKNLKSRALGSSPSHRVEATSDFDGYSDKKKGGVTLKFGPVMPNRKKTCNLQDDTVISDEFHQTHSSTCVNINANGGFAEVAGDTFTTAKKWTSSACPFECMSPRVNEKRLCSSHSSSVGFEDVHADMELDDGNNQGMDEHTFLHPRQDSDEVSLNKSNVFKNTAVAISSWQNYKCVAHSERPTNRVIIADNANGLAYNSNNTKNDVVHEEENNAPKLLSMLRSVKDMVMEFSMIRRIRSSFKGTCNAVACDSNNRPMGANGVILDKAQSSQKNSNHTSSDGRYAGSNSGLSPPSEAREGSNGGSRRYSFLHENESTRTEVEEEEVKSAEDIGKHYPPRANSTIMLVEEEKTKVDDNQQQWREEKQRRDRHHIQKPRRCQIRKWLKRQQYKPLHLRGQMRHVKQWDMILFIGTPLIGNLEDLRSSGLYLSDLGMHDNSRLHSMQGTQRPSEIEFAWDREKLKSKMLREATRKLEKEKTRTEWLLYSMMPREIAERMKNGERELTTCETFDNVTILFGNIHNFAEICNKVSAMKVIQLVSELFSLFDILSENHRVYKFETISSGVYMLVSGAPVKIEDHAHEMALMATHMLEEVRSLQNPLSEDKPLEFQIGIHSGPVVAGVIGQTTLQYCLFGNTVNISSRMQSTGQPMRIHLSKVTNRELEGTDMKTEYRGQMPIKGVGILDTYWLIGPDDVNSMNNDSAYASPKRITKRDQFNQLQS
eukprot:gene17077-18798_t